MPPGSKLVSLERELTWCLTTERRHAYPPAAALQTRPPPQALPPGGKLVSLERELTWSLTAKRFVWQASQGTAAKQGQEEALKDKVRAAGPHGG